LFAGAVDGPDNAGMAVLIRDAEPDDAETIAAVHVESWRGAYRGLIPQEVLDGLDVAARTAGWLRTMERTDPVRGAVLVAESGGQIIGFVHVRSTRDADDDPSRTAELTTMYLVPRAWGQGAGRALMDAAVSRLATAGYADATLWVLDTNERARRFYAAAGWTPDGAVRTEEARGATLNEVRYRRPLTAVAADVAVTATPT
jgi:GNAT superfamily N-acetyltransferase